MQRRNMLAAAGIIACLLVPPALSGCSSSGSATDAARSAAASLSANPQFQKDKARLEANMRKDFHPTHPIASAKVVVAETFPGADAQKIVVFAVTSFKPGVRHAGAERQAWEAGVVQAALNQSAQGVSGQPSIPGVSSTATAKSS